MKNEYAQWRKLDNAALAFPAVTGKNDTRVFRFYCELKEEIKEETLQKALDRTMEKYPLFRAVLRKGTVLVLPGETGYSGGSKGRSRCTLQRTLHSGQKNASFSGELL